MVEFLISQYKNASTLQICLELLAFIFGILSVWYAKNERVLVYPTGLIATLITTYLLFIAGYLGEMLINGYFTIMSIYGWYKWSNKNDTGILIITRTNLKEKITGIILFFITFFVVLAIYKLCNYQIKGDNYIDIFASSIFFTGMWFMANKKIENWILWVIGNVIVTPLYAYRGLGVLSLQYFIFTIIAIYGYLKWKKILNNTSHQL